MCPRRRSSERNPLTGGPVWDRPLRRSPDRLLYFCRGDPCGRPPTQVLRHPLPGLAAAGEVVQAHVKKVSQGQELRIFWAARAGFIVLIGPQGFSKSVTQILRAGNSAKSSRYAFPVMGEPGVSGPVDLGGALAEP